MNEELAARQFARDIDNIIDGNPVGETDNRPPTARQELEIVQVLVSADFSSESQVRRTLKLKLLNTPSGEKDNRMNMPIFQRPMARIAFVGLFLAILFLALSPLGATLAQSVIGTIQSWQLGDNTTAVSVEGDFEAVPAENGTTIIQPASEAPEPLEELAAGQEPIAFAQAQEKLSFTLRQPTFIPEGYLFNGVSVGGDGQASVEYINPVNIGLIGLLQTAVGEDNGSVQVTFSSDTIVEDVTVNGHEGLWALTGEEGLLVWEADGVNYQLMGLNNLELALQVAESIQ